jgi:hypothetical protein
MDGNARGLVEPRAATGNHRERSSVERSARIRGVDENHAGDAIVACNVDIPIHIKRNGISAASGNHCERDFVERPTRIRRIDSYAVATCGDRVVPNVYLPARVNDDTGGTSESRATAGNRCKRDFVERPARIRREDENVAVGVGVIIQHFPRK